MASVADEFMFLTGFGSTTANFELRTRALEAAVPAGHLLIGIDANDGRHLLLPVTDDERLEEDRRSKHVVAVESTYETPDGIARFVDLHCRTASLGRMFEQLAEDVLARIASGAEPASVCQQTLDDWRYLLERQRGALGLEATVGLHGELYALGLLARTAPLRAVEVWQGPMGKPQDFLSHGRAIEVKATQNVDASTVRVSNAAQLDPTGLEALDLLVLRVREDDRGPSLDERIEEVLDAGVPRIPLIERVQAAGYDYGSRSSPDRILIHSSSHWTVGAAFPSLRAAEIHPERRLAITNISYDLALPGPADHLGEDEIAGYLSNWIRLTA